MNEVLIENQELTEKAHPIMGFLEIIMQPYELGRKIIPRWFQIVAIAVLLETFCMTTGMYLVSKSDGVKSEMATLSNHIVKKLEKTRIFNEKEIEDRFYKDLEFGTAGLRGVIAAGTNRINIYTVRRATFGLAKSVSITKDDTIIIGG